MIKFPHAFPYEAWVVPIGGYRPRAVTLERPYSKSWPGMHHNYVVSNDDEVFDCDNLYYTETEACNASLQAMNSKLLALNKKTTKLNQQIMAIQQTINSHKD